MGERQRVEIGADVAAVLDDGRRRQQRRRMSQRKRRQAERDAQRQRVTLELDPRVVSMVREIAEAEGCSPAGVVDLMVVEGMRRYVAGEVEFPGNRRPSLGPRYEWVVTVQGVEMLRSALMEFLEQG